MRFWKGYNFDEDFGLDVRFLKMTSNVQVCAKPKR